MNFFSDNVNMDYGPEPYMVNVSQAAAKNNNFRTAIWTGNHAQMTLMSIPPFGEIGWESHPDVDQIIRVEHGKALVQMGDRQGAQNVESTMMPQDVIFVPAGTWHNIINFGKNPLKVSSIYAPPNHKKGTVHQTKEEAEYEENKEPMENNQME